MIRFRMLAPVASVLLLVAACGPEGVLPPTPTVFTSELAGENEVPAVASPAGGSVTATLTGTTLVVAGSFEGLTSDLSVIGGSSAHIHQGMPGENGPIVEALTVVSADDRSGTIAGTFDLDAGQVEAFEAGAYYVNIHTVANSQGELRAQLAADTPTFAAVAHTFDATLAPENEPHAVTSDATGAATGVLREDGTLTVSGTFEALGSALFDVGEAGPAHVHGGVVGEPGPVLFPLDVVADEDELGGRFGAMADVTTEEVEALLTGGYHVNVHTAEYEAGEIRGQLFPTEVETTATLDGEQAGVTTAATGSATATMNGYDLTVTGSFEGLESALHDVGEIGPAHIHVAPRGVTGGVEFPLDVDATDAFSGTFALDTVLTEEQRADFVAGNYYVNVHTADNQGGEIRGQFEPFEPVVDGAENGDTDY